jgi:hypothetical protein
MRLRSPYRICLVTTLAAAMLAGCSSAPPPEPSMAYGQWTWTDANYARCVQRSPEALRSVGYTPAQTFRGWFGNAGATSATVVCYPLGKSSLVTVNVASTLGLDVAKTSLRRLAVALIGNAPAGCTAEQC